MPVVKQPGATGGDNTSVLWQSVAASVTAAGSATGFPAINVTDPGTYNSWRANSLANAVLRFSFPTVTAVSGVGIAAHNLATSGSTVSIQHSADGTSWTVLMSHSPLTNDDLMFYFNTVSRRYWRIVLTGAIANLGVVVFGSRLEFPCTPVDSYTPTHHAKRYEKLFNSSITGNFLANRVIGAGGLTDVEFPLVSRDWVDGPLLGFEDHYNRAGTFFYAGWPDGKPQDMAYCRAGSTDDIMAVTYINGERLASVGFSIQTYVRV